MTVQWYPGHMAKTRRMIQENLKLVDLVVEILDARIPVSSRNPDLDDLVGEKPRLILLNRADQADPEMNRVWADWFRAQGLSVLQTDCKTGAGVKQFPAVVRGILADKIARWEERGQVGRPIRVMVAGVPNVGKSTFINQVAQRKAAAAENRPGLTRGKQWVTVDAGLELLDTPGILWPKFEDQTVGLHLAFTGAVKDTIMDLETLGCQLIRLLASRYPEAVQARYKIDTPEDAQGWELLEAAARKRGFLVSGGEVDLERMARVLLEEYRSGRLGRFTLEEPPAGKKELTSTEKMQSILD
ncbi:MAG: ribosome biogenesis GTPase YlqF [Clostridiales bacterium]|nr:ribosome biogenesis GTPase YlqF [Clostridiales bacterium]